MFVPHNTPHLISSLTSVIVNNKIPTLDNKSVNYCNNKYNETVIGSKAEHVIHEKMARFHYLPYNISVHAWAQLSNLLALSTFPR